MTIGNWVSIGIFVFGLAVAWGAIQSEVSYNEQNINRVEIDFKKYVDDNKKVQMSLDAKLDQIISKLNDCVTADAVTQIQLKDLKSDVAYLKKKLKQ